MKTDIKPISYCEACTINSDEYLIMDSPLVWTNRNLSLSLSLLRQHEKFGFCFKTINFFAVAVVTFSIILARRFFSNQLNNTTKTKQKFIIYKIILDEYALLRGRLKKNVDVFHQWLKKLNKCDKNSCMLSMHF